MFIDVETIEMTDGDRKARSPAPSRASEDGSHV